MKTMSIVLIAPGYKPLPPQGWGAVESIVWDYFENLKSRGIPVSIVNTSNMNQIVAECNRYSPHAVHIMYDDYVAVAPYLNCKNVYYTSHYAYITHPEFETRFASYFQRIFKKAVELRNHITILAISEEIRQVYVKHGFPVGKIHVVRNGAREDRFQFADTPDKPDRSVYVAKIETRKAQYKYQRIPGIDFVGNFQDSAFDRSQPNYLGEWTKPVLYSSLTHYGNLVLLSEGEADPLVVKEALMAGLGIVTNRCAAANLDLSKPFITLIPDDKANDVAFVREKIEENRRASLARRDEIRAYALETFAWARVVDAYLAIVLPAF